MPFIGRQPVIGNFQKCDSISVVNGQAAYTLQVGGVNVSPQSENHMLVSLNGILQAPVDSFTVSGSTLTFASNLVTGDVIDFVMILGNVLDLGVPSDNTVSLAKLTATGTKDSTTFLRGDNTFAEVSTVVKKIDNQINNTRTAISSSTSKTTILSGTFTNVQASSKVLVTIKMPMWGSEAGSLDIGFTWNGTDYDGGLTYTYENTDNITKAIMNKSFDNPASTGSISWVIYFKSANSTLQRPCRVVNPNSTEDARMSQQETQITFMEYIT